MVTVFKVEDIVSTSVVVTEGYLISVQSDDLDKDFGILQMFCVGYTDTLTMSVPLQVLKLLGADFDGKRLVHCHQKSL